MSEPPVVSLVVIALSIFVEIVRQLGAVAEGVIADVEIGSGGRIGEESFSLFVLHSFEEFSATFLAREEFDFDEDGAVRFFVVVRAYIAPLTNPVINVERARFDVEASGHVSEIGTNDGSGFRVEVAVDDLIDKNFGAGSFFECECQDPHGVTRRFSSSFADGGYFSGIDAVGDVRIRVVIVRPVI